MKWKDNIFECYDIGYFCRRCDYLIDKKVNYIWYFKRNYLDEVERG